METAGHHMDSSALVAVQRALRDQLLQQGRLHGEERGVASEMLLHLDEPNHCWSVCASWLMVQTGADRVDGGFSSAADRVYMPQIERRRDDIQLPSVLGAVFDAGATAIRTVWGAKSAVVYHDVEEDRRIDGLVRAGLLAAGTRSKIAVAVRDRGRDIGLMCLDSRRAFAWSNDHFARVDRLAREVIGPVLGAARELADTARAPAVMPPAPVTASSVAPSAPARTGPGSSVLTSAEWRVAQLVLAGCSYKEIAYKLDRSCSTIDHQLRSMRQKLGVNSTAKLMRELARLAASASAPAPSAGGSAFLQAFHLPGQGLAQGQDVRRAAGA